MRVAIHSQNRVSDKLRDSIERRLRFVLGRFGSNVRSVTVHLAAVKRSKEKAIKQCKIVVHFAPGGEVSVEDTDARLQAGADRATGRIARSVHRELERRHGAEAKTLLTV